MAVQDWNTDPDLNGTLEGIDVAEGSLPKWFNDCFRRIAAAIRVFYDKSYRKAETIKWTPAGDPDPYTTHADGDIWIEYTP